MTSTPTLSAMAEEIERLMKEATPGPWELSYTEVHGKRYGLNGIVPSDPAVLQKISCSGGAKSFTRYVIEPDMVHDNIENECRLIVTLVNHAPAIITALRDADRCRADLDQARRERDELFAACADAVKATNEQVDAKIGAATRALTAEAESKRLREALKTISEMDLRYAGVVDRMRSIARSALAAQHGGGG